MRPANASASCQPDKLVNYIVVNSPGISPSEFPIMIIPNPNGVYKLVVIVQFINFVNIPVYKLHHHHQLINGSYLGDDNLVKIG